MRLKKGVRQVNQKFFDFKKGEYGSQTSIKSTGDKIGIPDGWVIYCLGDAGTSVLLPGRHANTSPILSQRYSSIRAVPRAS